MHAKKDRQTTDIPHNRQPRQKGKKTSRTEKWTTGKAPRTAVSTPSRQTKPHRSNAVGSGISPVFRRKGDASQDEKGEKCQKGALTGDMGLNPVSLPRYLFSPSPLSPSFFVPDSFSPSAIPSVPVSAPNSSVPASPPFCLFFFSCIFSMTA